MPRRRLSSGSSSSSEDLGGRTRRRGTPQDPFPSEGTSDDEGRTRPHNDATTISRSRSDIISSACRYTQAEVTSARRSVLGWKTTTRELQLDFDPRHKVWHLVTPNERAARGRSEAPPGRAPGQNTQEDDNSLDTSSQNELLQPSNGGSASFAPVEIGTNACGNADLSTGAFAASGNSACLEAIDDVIDRPGTNSARDRCPEDEEASGDGAAICPVEGGLAAGGLVRQRADEDAANCGAAGNPHAMKDNDRPVKLTTDGTSPCSEDRRRKADSPPVSAPDASAGSTQQRDSTVERPASKQEGGGPEPQAMTTATPPPGTEFALGVVRKTSAGPEREQQDASKSDHIVITSELGTEESVTAAAAAGQCDSLSAEFGSRPVRPDNRSVAAGAMDRTFDKNGGENGDVSCNGDGRKDDSVEKETPGDAKEKREERRIEEKDIPSPKGSCGSKIRIPDGNDQLGQIATACPTESPIVETTPGPQPPANAGGPVRKAGRAPKGTDDESPTWQDRDGLLRATWRGEPVTLTGPIAITLEHTGVGKPYPGRKIGECDREGDPACARPRRDTQGAGGQPGSDGECVSSGEEDRIFSSDEESDGSYKDPPSQEKPTAESRVRKGHVNGVVNERSSGRRRSESSSTRKEAICDAKAGEGSLPRTTRKFDNEDRNHHHHRSARQQQEQNAKGNEALPVPRTGSPNNSPPQSHRTNRADTTLIASSLVRPVVFLAEPYLGPPVAGCPRTWPTGSSILADGCASPKKKITRGVGAARIEEKSSGSSFSRKERDGSSTRTRKSSGNNGDFSKDSEVDWEEGKFASDAKQTLANEGKPRKGERSDGRRSQRVGGARR